MRVFVSAGEASGDRYGAALVSEMRRLAPGSHEFLGIGGKRMAAAGVEPLIDSSAWGAIGICESFKVGRRVLSDLKPARTLMTEGEPGLFVPIDFGFVNVKLARDAKSAGWKVLYFVPPGSWRQDRQGGDLPHVTDAISTPFRRSEELLTAAGANARWFGHPLVQLVDAEKPKVIAGDGVAVLPGSRAQEVGWLLPVLAEVAKGVGRDFEFGVAPTVDPSRLATRWNELVPGRAADKFTPSDLYGVLSRARVGLVCSGTATLEAALCGLPQVVIYQAGAMLALQGHLMGLSSKLLSLPNILLGREAVPEVVKRSIDPAMVVEKLKPLFEDSPERAKQLEAYAELRELLAPPDAITRTAEWALELMA